MRNLLFAATVMTVAVAHSLPRVMESPRLSAEEILSMPEKNRQIVARSQKNRNGLYKELLTITNSKTAAFQDRWKALTLAANLKGKDSIEDVSKSCSAPEWFLKNACLLSLQQIDMEKAQKQALLMMNDKALVVRAAAYRVASAQMTPEKRELFWEELSNSRNFRQKQGLWIRSVLIEALAKNPEKRELPLFGKLLRDKDSRLHVYAVQALEQISDQQLKNQKATVAQRRDYWLKATR